MQKALAVAVLLLASTFASANAVSGSLPAVLLDVTSNGTDLFNATILTATASTTEGPGTGDFILVPVGTPFGPTSLTEATIATGGGFMASNATWGSFTATSATLINRTATFLNVELHGVFTPGPGFGSLTASPADAHLTYDQTGPSLSGAFTLETTTIPEPMSMALVGSGLVLCGSWVRRMRR